MNSNSKLVLVALLSGITTLAGYKVFLDDNRLFSKKSIVTQAPVQFGKNVGLSNEVLNFTEAADKTIHTVVHVKNVSFRTVSNPLMDFFYGFQSGQMQQQEQGQGQGQGQSQGQGQPQGNGQQAPAGGK